MWGFSEAWKKLDNVQTISQEINGYPEMTMEKWKQSQIRLCYFTVYNPETRFGFFKSIHQPM